MSTYEQPANYRDVGALFGAAVGRTIMLAYSLPASKLRGRGEGAGWVGRGGEVVAALLVAEVPHEPLASAQKFDVFEPLNPKPQTLMPNSHFPNSAPCMPGTPYL